MVVALQSNKPQLTTAITQITLSSNILSINLQGV